MIVLAAIEDEHLKRHPLIHLPTPAPALVDVDSHNVCRRWADAFSKLNPFWCGENNVYGFYYNSNPAAVWSDYARACIDDSCDARFHCYVKYPYRGCPIHILAEGLEGYWRIKCSEGTYLDMQKPGSANAWALCLTPWELYNQGGARARARAIAIWNSMNIPEAEWSVPLPNVEHAQVEEENRDTEKIISAMLRDLDVGPLTHHDITQAGGVE